MSPLPSLLVLAAAAIDVPTVSQVELQPLAAQSQRLVETLDIVGAPLPATDRAALKAARTVAQIQKVLDARILLAVDINPEQRVKVRPGPAVPALDENGWRSFIVKVVNNAGTTAELKVESPNAAPIYRRSKGTPSPESVIKTQELPDRWIDLQLYSEPPFRKELSGLEVEYRILQIYCGDRNLGAPGYDPTAAAGPTTVFKRDAKIAFNVGQGSQDLGFRNETALLFGCRPSVDLKLEVLDEDGNPTTAAFQIRDDAGRVYPSQAKRLAPDFFFHPQVYRESGESVRLPAGHYKITVTHGPEYLPRESTLDIAAGRPGQTASFKLQRWIDPARRGWISGDHHIHAAGCAHYEDPTQGVTPRDMWRHIVGEDLRVGCSLTWGPCYYFQKRYFTGKADKLSTDKYVMRYDIEVSGWSSHKSGHLCLLRLHDQDYPGTKVMQDWPNLGLSVLKWAKAQGAVTGPAHSGWGLQIPGTELPNYKDLPRFDGIGANEYIMQVTHQVPGPGGRLVPAVDFMSMVDTPYTWELNMWYHTLNAGFRTRISGETDFPCIYGERVGMGRAYVKLDHPEKVDFDRWTDGIAAGRAYVSDGKSHLMDFRVNDREVGTSGSELRLAHPGSVEVSVQVAALLGDTPMPEVQARPVDQKPYWDLERARIDRTRLVPLEVLVNGVPIAKREITADGTLREEKFPGVRIDRSSWVAVRILPSSHTNPVFVVVGNKPIRANRRSVEWCLKSVDACWMQKRGTYKPAELPAAQAAYDHARKTYRKILAETDVN